MKKVMLTILALPLLAGCFWNKKADVVESNADQEQLLQETNAANDAAMAESASDMSDEK